ncbi:hypothetical protein H5410_039376 [Solanum commersonii]|uniref:Uncharacterized protein n=1 Tax=Solanum commersonii TaxID=4109 RepID=A0A9J5YEV2_SOLCO|nr:hypothetical protein H5410_039376 [Solanum commersonii]
MKSFGKNDVGIPDHQKFMGYSTQKWAKWGVYLLRGSVDLENGPFWQLGRTGSIDKIAKNPWTIAHENWQNKGCSCSGNRLTLKMGYFGRQGQLAS